MLLLLELCIPLLDILLIVAIIILLSSINILLEQIKTLDLSERQYEFIEKVPNEVLNKCNIIFNAIYVFVK